MGSGLCFGDWVVTVTQDEFLDLIRLADWRMANPWTQSIVITLPKKGNLQQRQNYRTISLISHPIKVMLKIILNRSKPQAEKIIAEVKSQRMTTPSFAEKWRLQYNHGRKGNQLESTTSQQNWSKQVERM